MNNRHQLRMTKTGREWLEANANKMTITSDVIIEGRFAKATEGTRMVEVRKEVIEQGSPHSITNFPKDGNNRSLDAYVLKDGSKVFEFVQASNRTSDFAPVTDATIFFIALEDEHGAPVCETLWSQDAMDEIDPTIPKALVSDGDNGMKLIAVRLDVSVSPNERKHMQRLAEVVKLSKRMQEKISAVKDIDRWIAEFVNRKDVRTNPDGSWDVDGDVYIGGYGLDELPFKFNRVGGNFNCRYNLLKDMRNVPRIIGGSFNIECNLIESLIDGPVVVGGIYNCSVNPLTSLEHIPREIKEHLFCIDCKLTSLKHCPDVVGMDFLCHGNPITTFPELLTVKVGGRWGLDEEQKKAAGDQWVEFVKTFGEREVNPELGKMKNVDGKDVYVTEPLYITKSPGSREMQPDVGTIKKFNPAMDDVAVNSPIFTSKN